MEQKDRNFLRKQYMELAAAIQYSIKVIVKDLWRRGLLTQPMADTILEGNSTDHDRAMALLDLLPRRGPKAFNAFYETVVAAQVMDAADILRPDLPSHHIDILPAGSATPSASPAAKPPEVEELTDDDEGVPDYWPHDELPDLKRFPVKTFETLPESRQKKYIKQYKDSLSEKGKGIYYQMKRKSRGKVYIFNNEIFTTLPNRTGTGKDRMALERLFRLLGFSTCCFQGRKSEEMWQEMIRISEADFSDVDCFILFILTHGHKGVVFGTNGILEEDKKPQNCVSIQAITELFVEAKSLLGKPKLFFVQACQGNKRDAGFNEKTDGPGGQEVPEPIAPTLDRKKPEPKALDYLSQEESDSSGQKIASRADQFIAMATPPDFVSWRREDFGTWFIQAIVEIFSKYAYKHDLQKLMQMANGLVGKAETKRGGSKQTLEKRDTFHKEFRFFPGLHMDDSSS